MLFPDNEEKIFSAIIDICNYFFKSESIPKISKNTTLMPPHRLKNYFNHRQLQYCLEFGAFNSISEKFSGSEVQKKLLLVNKSQDWLCFLARTCLIQFWHCLEVIHLVFIIFKSFCVFRSSMFDGLFYCAVVFTNNVYKKESLEQPREDLIIEFAEKRIHNSELPLFLTFISIFFVSLKVIQLLTLDTLFALNNTKRVMIIFNQKALLS